VQNFTGVEDFIWKSALSNGWVGKRILSNTWESSRKDIGTV